MPDQQDADPARDPENIVRRQQIGLAAMVRAIDRLRAKIGEAETMQILHRPAHRGLKMVVWSASRLWCSASRRSQRVVTTEAAKPPAVMRAKLLEARSRGNALRRNAVQQDGDHGQEEGRHGDALHQQRQHEIEETGIGGEVARASGKTRRRP